MVQRSLFRPPSFLCASFTVYVAMDHASSSYVRLIVEGTTLTGKSAERGVFELGRTKYVQVEQLKDGQSKTHFA